MTRKQIQKIMNIAGFTCNDGIITTFGKKYQCGAKVSYFFDTKDKQIMLNWHTDYSSDFQYPKNFPMVNTYHHHKATTFHHFDDFMESLKSLEEQYGIK
jgi:hypothetical protein